MKTKEFKESFSTVRRGLEECLEQQERKLIDVRIAAAKQAKYWLLEHGYFNGHIECSVCHDKEAQQVNVTAVLTDFGLPHRNEEGE